MRDEGCASFLTPHPHWGERLRGQGWGSGIRVWAFGSGLFWVYVLPSGAGVRGEVAGFRSQGAGIRG